MGCNEVQKRLSAYIEGSISAEEKVLIDKHLKACQRCNESLADLRKTVEYLQKLEEVEPPSWLTQKVMTRVRSEAEPKRGILQKVFFPLHIKLPIEAVAAILIAITTIYVFKTIQPEMKLARAPSEEVTSRLLSEEQEKAAAVDEGKPIAPKAAPQFRGAERGEIPAAKSTGAPKGPVKAAKRDKSKPLAGAVATDESKREALSYERSARSLAEGKEQGISLTVTVQDIETARKEVAEAFRQLGGKLIVLESLENKVVIIVELDVTKVNQLFERLKGIGKVEERKLTAEARDGDVAIRIEIVRMAILPQSWNSGRKSIISV